LRAGSMFAAGPQPVDRPGRRIREDARAVDDFRVLRRRERHLDHVDAEERRVRIFTGLESRTAGELFRRSDQAGPRAVHIEIARILRIGHERMRVRSAARLNRRDLARLAEIADIENADAAEPFGADLVLNALRAAVDAASPASRSPALRPTRGSAAGVDPRRSCAPPVTPTHTSRSDMYRRMFPIDLIADAPSSVC